MGSIRNSIFSFLCALPILAIAQGPKSNIDYVEDYKYIAVSEMHRVGIPASITLAQGILESSFGKSRLAIEGNNHFGIKCHLNWVGKVMFYDDDEKDECFRVYENAKSSYHDHSEFLTSRDRYAFLFELNKKNYKGWAKGLKKAGYATAKDYSDRLIDLIERYELDQYDTWKQNKLPKKDRIVSTEEIVKAEPTVVRSPKSFEVFSHRNNIKYVTAKEGERAMELASRIHIWEWEVLRYNEIESDYVFEAGEKVFIQPKRKKAKAKTYIVKEGDSLFSISQKFGIKQRYILLRNNFRTELELRPGVELLLRGSVK